jgi:type I protein arginine methyltransferase
MSGRSSLTEYTIADHGHMIAEKVRMDAFAAALDKSIGDDSVVVDLGGGTGIFTLIACRLGARRVFAIEKDDVIDIAKQVVAANGYADRVDFFEDFSTNVRLPEPADVIVSDIRGALPLYRLHVPTIVDARKRFLARGGVMIPRRDTLWVSVAEVPDLYRDRVSCWDDFGFDMSAARKLAANTWSKQRIDPDAFVAEPRELGVLNYETIEDPNFSGEARCRIERTGIAHGVLVWFDTVLADGVGYSCGPGEPVDIYGSGFFPFEQPVPVTPGDHVSIRIAANLIDGDYVWRWGTSVHDEAQTVEKASFSQSTLLGFPLPANRVERSSATYVPELNELGRVARVVLELIASGHSLGEIAERMSRQFPEHFATVDDALRQATRLSLEYAR